MTSDADQRFTLLHDDHSLAVETSRSGIETVTRLVVDGTPVAEGKNWFEPVKLTHDGLTVEVQSTSADTEWQVAQKDQSGPD